MNKKRIFSLLHIIVIIMIGFIVCLQKIEVNRIWIYGGCFFIFSMCAIFFIIFRMKKRLFGLIITFVILSLFSYRIIVLDHKSDKASLKILDSLAVVGRVSEFPYSKGNKTICKFKVIGIKGENQIDYWKVDPFIILLKIKDPSRQYQKGSILKIENKISLPQEKIYSFRYRDFLFFRGVYGIIQAADDEIVVIKDKIKNPVGIAVTKLTLWRVRDSFLKKIERVFSRDSYSFVLSIFFGIRSELKDDIYREFQNTGMTHLLAISGLHIGFIGMVFFKLFRLVLSKAKAYIVSIIILIMYLIMIVPSASSLRAFLMFAFFGLFFVVGLKSQSISLLSLSGIVLLFTNPYYVFDLGFQFSFLATLSILVFSNDIKKVLPNFIPGKMKSLLSVTLAAFFSLFFLQWALFGKIALFAIISSPIIVPLFGFLFSFLLFGFIAFYLSEFIFLAKILDFAIFIFLKIIHFLNFIPPIKLPNLSAYLGYLIFPLFYLLYAIFIGQIAANIHKQKKVPIDVDISEKFT